jgi:hypothetical protein
VPPLVHRLTAAEDSIISKLRNKYHVVVTADGSVYAQWQVRVCYWHFQKLKKEHPDSDAGGFTRLLHSGKPDGLMAEIPTAVVDPLPKDVPDGGYVVLHRPYGLLQWVQKYAHRLQEDYILMSEPDHLFLKLPPLWATPVQAAAAPFFYITPKIFKNLIDKYNSRNAPIESMAPIGNSPVMMHKAQLEEICPIWYDLAVKFKRDNQTEKAFGWVQEMYAFSVASSQLAAGPVKYTLQRELMIQPPWDEQLTAANGREAYILHYTYGQDCDEKTGTPLTDKVGSWHFDKRDYERKYPARNITLPTKCRAKAMVAVVAMINEASAAIEPWEWRPR